MDKNTKRAKLDLDKEPDIDFARRRDIEDISSDDEDDKHKKVAEAADLDKLKKLLSGSLNRLLGQQRSNSPSDPSHLFGNLSVEVKPASADDASHNALLDPSLTVEDPSARHIATARVSQQQPRK